MESYFKYCILFFLIGTLYSQSESENKYNIWVKSELNVEFILDTLAIINYDENQIDLSKKLGKMYDGVHVFDINDNKFYFAINNSDFNRPAFLYKYDLGLNKVILKKKYRNMSS